ncbi:MAG: hypothetical protein CSB13_06660 [Chloroflexi bacterium]|nr:MAG: hypothetical protein CSB13_06660 [Chloroflexota bacterium]
MSDKLQTKDLVTIGLFFVIYSVLFLAVGIIGLVPILYLAYPFVFAIVAGTVVMLFMAKVPKPWALFIFGTLSAFAMLAMVSAFGVPLLVALVFISLAEFFFRKGGFKSFKYNAIAYGFFSCWTSGSFIQLLLVRDKFIELNAKAGMSPEYFEKLDALLSWPSMALVILGGFLGGIIGAYIGKAMLKKHFEKAGII